MKTTRMRREVEVKLTREDIEMGVKRDCCKCPTARAIARTLGVGMGSISVTRRDISALVDTKDIAEGFWMQGCSTYSSMWTRIAYTPNIVEGFMEHFDRGSNMRPIKFEIELIRDDLFKNIKS